jgi:glutathione S-transferase
MPFIVDGGKPVADSTFILNHLTEHRGIALHETPEAIAFQRLVEENLYFVLLYSRWIDKDGFAAIDRDFRSLFPPLVGRPFLRLLRRKLRNQAFAQGLGRHSHQEVYDIGSRDVSALARFLGDKKYFLGENFSGLDATAYGFLITILKQPIESELQLAVRSHGNLVAYCEREERDTFPEYADTPQFIKQ